MHVILVAAMTLCGRISPASMGSEWDRRQLEEARERTDASLMGASTLRTSDPEMRIMGGRLPEDRIRAVITAGGDIPCVGKKLFSKGPPVVVFTSKAAARRLGAALPVHVRVIVLPARGNGLSLVAAVGELEALGVKTLLIEGGGRLNYAALAEGIVDELQVTLTPRFSGDCHAATLADGDAPLGDPFLPLELLSCTPAETGEVILRYRRKSVR